MMDKVKRERVRRAVKMQQKKSKKSLQEVFGNDYEDFKDEINSELRR